MKKLFTVFFTAFILSSLSALGAGTSVSLTDYLTSTTDDVASIRMHMIDREEDRSITEPNMIEKFFKTCSNIQLTELSDKEFTEVPFDGLFIEVFDNDGKMNFAYISIDGYADKYSLMMSRLPAKAYKIENFSEKSVIAELLSLGDKKEIKFSNWAKEYITELHQQGVCNFDDYTIPATRLEFCEMFYNYILFINAPYPDINENEASFVDCNNQAVKYLFNLGVINGTGENIFSPNKKISREEVAVIVYRLANKMNFNGFLENYLLSSYMFADCSEISDWAVEPVTLLKSAGIMDGVGEDMFAPKSDFTREQAATLAVKLFSVILKNSNTDLRVADHNVTNDARESEAIMTDEEIDKVVQCVKISSISDNFRNFIEKESVALTNEMLLLANNKQYIELFGEGVDSAEEIKSIISGDYSRPKRITCVELNFERAIEMLDLELSDETLEIIRNKYNGTVAASILNSRNNVKAIVMASMLSQEKGYVMPEGFKQTTAILEYDGDFISVVSFNEIGDKVISARSTFVEDKTKSMLTLINMIQHN